MAAERGCDACLSPECDIRDGGVYSLFVFPGGKVEADECNRR